MLVKEEFYFRFLNIVPGKSLPHSNASATNFDIFFEPLNMSGLEEMHRYSKDPRLYEYFEFDPFDSIEKTRAYIQKLEQRMEGEPLNKTSMYWFVRRKIDQYLIGTATLTNLNFDRQSVEWGYGVDPELWGKGYILQIQECLKRYVFETLQLNRLHGISMVENKRTISSVLSAGMKYEGTHRQFYRKNGIYHDGWQYGMVSSDYFEQSHDKTKTLTLYTVEDVIKILSSILTEEQVTVNTSMSDSYQWDSLTHMTIMVALQEQLGVTLSPIDISRATSVKTILDIISQPNSKE
jgi:[ribosomal protein S5]-alanine N-acetyltransferase